VTQKRSGARHPTEKPLPLGPAWRPMVLYGPLALLGGAPLAYFTFVDPKLLEVQAGPFQLVPIMLWPGLLALAFGQWRELGWHPPRLAALALAALYPLLVAIGAAVLALWTGAGAVAPDASLGDAARDWGRSTLASFAGSLFPVLGEEVGWRGFVQRRLQAWGPHRSVLTAAAVATAYHALATLGPGFKEGGAWAVASFLGAVFLLQVGLGLRDADTVPGGAAGAGEQFGGGDQRLRRDAPDVEAGPADARPLHQRDAHPQLGGPQRGHVPAGPSSQNGKIVRIRHSIYLLV